MAQYSDAFGRKVREWLDEAGLSNREAARRAQGMVSHYTIGEMRAGRIPHAESMVALARALRRDPNELLEAAGKSWLRFDEQAWTAAGNRVMSTQAAA